MYFQNETVQPRYFQNKCSVYQFLHIYICEFFKYISKISLSILLQPNMWTDPGNI